MNENIPGSSNLVGVGEKRMQKWSKGVGQISQPFCPKAKETGPRQAPGGKGMEEVELLSEDTSNTPQTPGRAIDMNFFCVALSQVRFRLEWP